MSRTKALQISPSPSDPALTPSQKRFNTLIREIERARQTLAAWRENSAAYRQAYAEVLQPLQEELFAGHRQWLFALDAALGQRNWSKAERGTLREVLCDSADELLSARDDAEIKALFDKYSEVDYDTEQRDMMLAMKDLTEMVTGLDLGDDKSIGSEEELFARMRQSMHEHLAKEQTQRDTKAHRRQTAAQKRREDEAKQATQSVREVFRKLTSALHPDRETDERQREVKTALMQRVNMAYEANDLLTLLELQLQIEQID
ncbi:MAG: J domain-containing protein, partial [Rhodanobacter sp.]|nr:J domain-containing protein [Rhodanobacter sp.]